MTNPFARFYDTEIEIYSLSDGGYSARDTKTYLGKIVCDIQPYHDDTDSEIYGLDSGRQYKLYSDKYPILKDGNLVLFGGFWYRIVRCNEWTFGMAALIRSVDNEG